MKQIALVVPTMLALFLWQGFLYSQPAQPRFPGEAPPELEEEMEYTPKSTALAFIIGFFPGFFVHGLGHYYAGDPEMGATLLGVEGGGLIVFGMGLLQYRYGKKYMPYWSTDGQAKKAGNTAMLIGGLIFGAGWITDFVHAPISVSEFNRRYKLPIRSEYRIIGNTQYLLACVDF